jgi:hypothetical protein
MAEKEKPRVEMATVIADGIDLDRRLFEETGNPMWAWSAVFTVTEYGFPLPDWLAIYLREAAADLIGTAGKGRPSAPNRVLAALGFRRRTGADDLKDYHTRMMETTRGVRMMGRIQFMGESAKRAAFELEGSRGSEKSHERGWKFVRHLLNLLGETK